MCNVPLSERAMQDVHCVLDETYAINTYFVYYSHYIIYVFINIASTACFAMLIDATRNNLFRF